MTARAAVTLETIEALTTTRTIGTLPEGDLHG
jgi:hypothetical protein